MYTIRKRLSFWLNLLLVCALSGNLLWPLLTVSAAPIEPVYRSGRFQTVQQPATPVNRTTSQADRLTLPLQQGQVVTYTWDFESGEESWIANHSDPTRLAFWEKTPSLGSGDGVWRAPAYNVGSWDQDIQIDIRLYRK